MLTKILVIHTVITIVYCCHSFKNVEVHGVLREGSPLVINVTGCLERKSFVDGNKTRNLVEIDINRQDLPRIRKDDIRHLIHLRKLTIRNTNLKQIDPDVFRNVFSLETVQFVSNKLKFIADGVFNYQDFVSVSLYNNEIDAMDDIAFSNMTLLKHLNISYNKLKVFKSAWFYGVPNLTSIDFQHNEIETLPRKAFTTITNVAQIYLSHNNISNIEPDAFQGLRSLTHLDLKYNLVKTINANSFPPNFKINVLYINANRLNYLERTLLSGMTIYTISLDGNPWNCYCYRSMAKLLESKGTKVVFTAECHNLNIPTCAVALVSSCKEEYDEDLTKYYYTQAVYGKDSKCIRYLE